MIVFGVLGYLMRKLGYEPAPLVLAFVLGPMLENNLRKSLILSQGDLMIFVERPISAVCLAFGGRGAGRPAAAGAGAAAGEDCGGSDVRGDGWRLVHRRRGYADRRLYYDPVRVQFIGVD